MNTATVLIIEDDDALLGMLSLDAQRRGYGVLSAATLPAACRLIGEAAFEVALVDLTLGAESGLDAIRAIRQQSPDTEIVVISASTSLASALASYELDAFAFVPKPFDLDQLFATVERAIEHRAVVLSNRRLVWEQRLINDVGEELRHLLAPEQLVERVLRRLMSGMSIDASLARLLNPETGAYDLIVINASEEIRRKWAASAPASRPSDRVLATRAPFRVADFHAGLDPVAAAAIPLRSGMSVPMFAGDDLIGVLSVASPAVDRFSSDDERVVGVIANQAAVGVQNARLHAFIRAGKQEWEATFDAISDSIAVFDRQGRLLRGNEALAAYMGLPVTGLRGLTCDEVGLCGGQFPACAVGHAAGSSSAHAEITRPGDRIFNVTTCPVQHAADGAAIVQIAKDVTLEIQTARRMRQMSDEIAATNGRLTCHRRASEGYPGAAAAGREAVGHRPAGGRRRPRTEQSADQRDRLRAAAPGRGQGRVRGGDAAHPGRSGRTTCGVLPRNRSARRRSSATCWHSRGGSPRPAPSRT